MPSSEKGLDSRRLKDVRARDMSQDNSPDAAYARLRHARLVAILGEAGAQEYKRNLDAFQKAWGRR